MIPSIQRPVREEYPDKHHTPPTPRTHVIFYSNSPAIMKKIKIDWDIDKTLQFQISKDNIIVTPTPRTNAKYHSQSAK